MDILPFLKVTKKIKKMNITVLVNGKFNNNINLKLDKDLEAKKRQITFEIKKRKFNQ